MVDGVMLAEGKAARAPKVVRARVGVAEAVPAYEQVAAALPVAWAGRVVRVARRGRDDVCADH